MVIPTGIVGAMLGPVVLYLLKVRDWTARGMAMGTASHGIGAARALQVNEPAGALAGLAIAGYLSHLAAPSWVMSPHLTNVKASASKGEHFVILTQSDSINTKAVLHPAGLSLPKQKYSDQ